MDFIEVAGSRIASGSDRAKLILRVFSVVSAAASMAKHMLSASPRALRILPSDKLDDMLSSLYMYRAGT